MIKNRITNKINYILSLLTIANINSVNNKTNSVQKNMKVRDNKYDNLKGLAIIAVVICHFSQPSSTEFLFYSSIYNFCAMASMAIFFFASGYFSKISDDWAIKAFKNIFIPYIFFSILMLLFNSFILGKNMTEFPFLNPSYGLWFLLVLFMMRLLIPIISKIRYVFIISILVALLVGTINIPNYLSLSRFLCFLPIFILGYDIKRYTKKINEFYSKITDHIKMNKIAVFFLLLIFIVVVGIFFSDIPGSLVQFKSSYGKLDLSILKGMILRLSVIISGIILVLLLRYLMTNKTTFLTKLGLNSMAIYILHLFVVRYIMNLMAKYNLNFVFNSITLSAIFIIFNVTILIYVLSRDSITNLVNKITSFIGNLIIYPRNKKSNSSK